jgi:hypothetical protein
MNLLKSLIEELSTGTTDAINALKAKAIKGKVENILTRRLIEISQEDPEKSKNLDMLERKSLAA